MKSKTIPVGGGKVDIKLEHITDLKLAIMLSHIVRYFCLSNIEVHCQNFDPG